MKTVEDIRAALSAAPDAGPTILNESCRTHDFLAPVSLPFRLPTSVYGAMLAIWHLRPVLQRRFPLHKGRARDYIRFLAWCASEGRRQYVILRSIPEWDAELARPISLPVLKGDRWAGGFSVAMLLFGVAKYHYAIGPMLRDAFARHRVARAYWRTERRRRLLPVIDTWQSAFLVGKYASPEAFAQALWIKKTDSGKSALQLFDELGLADVYPGSLEQDDQSLVQAGQYSEHDLVSLPPRITRSPIRLPLRAIRTASWAMKRMEPRPDEFQLAGVTGRIRVARRQVPRSSHPFGVNLFGYAKGEIGIGEDVRLVALALKTQGIPFCIVNVQPGSNVSQEDASVDEWIVPEPIYAINIFCTTGIEQTRYACEHGLGVFQGRYNIGFWPWELPDWPASCHHAYSMVDEIWGISSYTANAYRNAPCPVHAMTLPVTIDVISSETRADFGLPADDYLFVFSFDFNSTLTRKNPMGVVRAFQLAFPRNSKDRVGLVLKASHVNPKNQDWKQILKATNRDSRIHIIDETLRRPQVLALYRCCDCYVSLHRAEGFGRSLAEALLLDLQLIATNFSGNLDFCTPERAALVPCDLRDLDSGDYFYAQGQHWGDPDTRHAAALMRDVYERPRPVHLCNADFCPERVGARYGERILELKKLLEKGKRPSRGSIVALSDRVS